MAPATPCTSTKSSPSTAIHWAPLGRRTRVQMEEPSTSCSTTPRLQTKRETGSLSRQPAPPKMVRSAPAKSSLRRGRPAGKAMEVTLDGLTPITCPLYQDPTTPYFDQAFQIRKTLGKGSFGEVVAAKSRSSNELCAVKIPLIPSTKTSRYHEARAFIRLPPHQNLLKFYGAWEEADKKILIQTEICHQNLADVCQNRLISEEEVWNVIVDLVQVVGHLHSEGMIHNDIKPENVLMTKDGICRLGDLGLVEDLSQKTHGVEEGDNRYMAPEVLSTGSSKETDIFSLGVTFLEVTTNVDLPMNGDLYHQLRNGMIPSDLFEGRSKDLEELIRLMIDRDPSVRPTIKELIDHPVIRNRIDARDEFIEKCENENNKETPLREPFTAAIFTPPRSSPSIPSPPVSPIPSPKRSRLSLPTPPNRNQERTPLRLRQNEESPSRGSSAKFRPVRLCFNFD